MAGGGTLKGDMTVVFVHGVPETWRIWDGLRTAIGRESVALELPGFGCARPLGFGATKDAYASWLADALRGIRGRIDLVGHDWGALLALRVASAFELPLHSWAVDVANVFHPRFVWHEAAQIWQTPGAGEDWLRTAREAEPGSPRSTASRLARGGVPADLAEEIGTAHDETMSQCILDLYRSALPNVNADWGAAASRPTRAPGLVLLLPDPPEDEAMSLDVARLLGARTARLDGLQHCWMAQEPAAVAAVLEQFWSDLGKAN
jgi:pimeloyl-ACP methyl ester carboxylesterase